jgi:dipeptidyl aminopeptidase/acylaminoacyl peptidase
MWRTLLQAVIGFVSMSCAAVTAAEPAESEPLPSDIRPHPVTIWSDGTRMAGDLYVPPDLQPGEKRAAILFCAGTGGTKKGNGALYGKRFVREGFVVLTFDYRGWGESDCKLMLTEPMPIPNKDGTVTVTAKRVLWQMDLADQTLDIRCALSYLAGEPCVDARRIGIFGTSYGGGLVTWVAGNDSNVRCVVAQVPGMGGGRGAAALKYASDLAIKQSRGETEPVPMETGKLTGKMAAYPQMRANPAKGIGYSPIDAAARITAPMLIVVAEKEDLMSNEQNGLRVYQILQANHVASAYQVLPGIGHYGVYRESFSQATQLASDWFHSHLDTRPDDKSARENH